MTEERTAGEERAKIDGHLFFILYDASGRKKSNRTEDRESDSSFEVTSFEFTSVTL